MYPTHLRIASLLTVTHKVDNYVIYARRLLSIDFNNVRDVVLGAYVSLLDCSVTQDLRMSIRRNNL